MWWPFAKRGSRIDDIPQIKLPVVLPKDFSVFGANDACIKIWLPEKLIQAIALLSSTHTMSRPDILRQLFFEHVYGRPALEQLKAWKKQEDKRIAKARFSESADTAGIRFSPARELAERTITTQLLGKSVDDFKLWLPAPLKDELERLAKAEHLPLSDYLRKTLVRLLLGESFYHKWREAIGKLPEEVLRFEQEAR